MQLLAASLMAELRARIRMKNPNQGLIKQEANRGSTRKRKQRTV